MTTPANEGSSKDTIQLKDRYRTKVLRPFFKKKQIKLQTLISLLIYFVVFITAFVTSTFMGIYVQEKTIESLEEKLRDIARPLARSELVIHALEIGERKEEVNRYANEILALTEVDFVVVMDMNLIRLSHPLPEEVGRSFFDREDASRSLKGEEYYTIARGPLGLGMRIFTPVYNENGEQIGVVVVGVTIDVVEEKVRESRLIVLLGAFLQLLIGIIGAHLISKYIRKILFGLEPEEIAKIFEERNTVLESVQEGILVANLDGKISLANQEALRLMNINEDENVVGKPADEYIPLLNKVIKTGEQELNHEQEFYGKIVVINCYPIIVEDEIVGGIATFKDRTEIKELAEQLTGIQLYTESLRAQSHEFMNKLHVILGMLHLKKYDDLHQFINSMINHYQVEFNDVIRKIKNPVFSGFLLGKLSKARERAIEMKLSDDSFMPNEIPEPVTHEIITIIGNLIENAFDAVSQQEEKKVFLSILVIDNKLRIQVYDNGPGIPETIRNHLFEKGISTKGEGKGYGLYLTKQAVERLNGELTLKSGKHDEWRTCFDVIIPMITEGEAE